MTRKVALILLIWIAAQQAHATVSAVMSLAINIDQHLHVNDTSNQHHQVISSESSSKHSECETSSDCCTGLCHSVRVTDYNILCQNSGSDQIAVLNQIEPELIVYSFIKPPKFA